MTPSSTSPPVHLSRSWAIAICALVPVVFGVHAGLLSQDANWDLQNYHWYNPYAFLTGRLGQDIAPAHVPTFYNPTLDVPFFLLAQVFSARAMSFVLGFLQGLNFIVLYGLAMRVLAPVAAPQRRLSALGIAFVGMMGGGNLGMSGTTFYDNIISLFVLASMWTVIATDKPTLLRLVLAGLLVGMGTGLKLPTAVFAVGLCAACFVVGHSFRERFQNSFVFGVGVLIGFAVFAGHWTLYLWDTYHNPVFPYFNTVFQSDMGMSTSYRDMRYVPENVLEIIFFPIAIALNSDQAGEIVFRDWRIAGAFIMLLLTPVVLLLSRNVQREAPLAHIPVATYICVASAASYVMWLIMFGIYRYLIPIEMLGPLLVVIATTFWPGPARFKTNLAIALMALLFVTAKPGNWGRIAHGEAFVTATPPAIANPDNSMVLMAGNTPTAWVIPFFPPAVSFVRIQGFITSPDDGDTGLNRKIRARIEGHTGDFYMLVTKYDLAFAQGMAARYGLVMDVNACRSVNGNLGFDKQFGIELCDLKRVSAQ